MSIVVPKRAVLGCCGLALIGELQREARRGDGFWLNDMQEVRGSSPVPPTIFSLRNSVWRRDPRSGGVWKAQEGPHSI